MGEHVTSESTKPAISLFWRVGLTLTMIHSGFFCVVLCLMWLSHSDGMGTPAYAAWDELPFVTTVAYWAVVHFYLCLFALGVSNVAAVVAFWLGSRGRSPIGWAAAYATLQVLVAVFLIGCIVYIFHRSPIVFGPAGTFILDDPSFVWRSSQCVFILIGPLWLLLGRAVWWLLFRYRIERRLRLCLCINCGYDLRASSGRCPECGEPIPAKEATRAGA